MKQRLIDLDKFLDDFYGNDVCPKAIIPLAKERIEKKKQELFKKYGVDAIPTEWVVGRLHSLYKSEMFGSSQDEYTEALERLLQEWWKWRKENE